jgi:uncharacterized protein (TIGR00159 family)
MFLDIFIMWLVLYYAIRIVRASAKTMQIFKGILLVLIIDAFATFLGLKTVSYLTNIFINWGFLAIIIIFQPEIRSILERMGKTNIFSRMTTLTGNEKEHLVDQIVTAAMLLSKDQTGALISIEQSHTLEDFIATGTKLNSDVTAELLTSLFVTSTPLHDGAVIIQGDKIACASAYFPPTNLDLPSRYGARHRAAIGISEITDALTIVVSEETGAISITESGRIMTVNRKQLRDTLLRVICGEETEVTGSGGSGLSHDAARDIIIDDEISEEREKSRQEEKQEKIGQTGVLSKLALRRQEKKAEKIEVEEVVNAEMITPAKEEGSDAGIHRLEEEASEIKLPKKKERPTPSYPKNASSKRFEEERRLEREEKERIEKRRAEEEAARLAMREATDAEEARRAAEERNVQQRETHRMSPEEVKAAREAMKQRLAGNAKPEPVPEPEPEAEIKSGPVILNEDMRQFDTTKLDLSKIMGMDDELSRTFEMIDSIDEDKSSESEEKGGER